MNRLEELLAAYPPGQRSELERELLGELEQLRVSARDGGLEQAASICDSFASEAHRAGAVERAKIGEQLAAVIRSRKSP